MTSYEPTSGWNLPPGVFEGSPDAPWNREELKTCGDCLNLVEGCCDYGICELEFEAAFAMAQRNKRCGTPWEAARWALEWIPEHYRDMQEDWCEHFEQ